MVPRYLPTHHTHNTCSIEFHINDVLISSSLPHTTLSNCSHTPDGLQRIWERTRVHAVIANNRLTYKTWKSVTHPTWWLGCWWWLHANRIMTMATHPTAHGIRIWTLHMFLKSIAESVAYVHSPCNVICMTMFNSDCLDVLIPLLSPHHTAQMHTHTGWTAVDLRKNVHVCAYSWMHGTSSCHWYNHTCKLFSWAPYVLFR